MSPELIGAIAGGLSSLLSGAFLVLIFRYVVLPKALKASYKSGFVDGYTKLAEEVQQRVSEGGVLEKILDEYAEKVVEADRQFLRENIKKVIAAEMTAQAINLPATKH